MNSCFWSSSPPGCATVSVLVISASQDLLELHGSRMGSPTFTSHHRAQSKEYKLSSRDVVNSRFESVARTVCYTVWDTHNHGERTEPVRVSFLSCLGTVSYQIRILMYPECILSVCVYPEGYMYLECILGCDVSQMYLTSPVTFQENTCILTFCMYFTRIPNESKILKVSETTRYKCILMMYLDVSWYMNGTH